MDSLFSFILLVMEKLLRIHQIRCKIGHVPDKEDIAKKLRCHENDILSFEIEKESLDARKDELNFSYTVLAQVKNASKYLKNRDITEGKKEIYEMPQRNPGIEERPVIIGFGPSGMYAALILAECGYRPVVVERGKNVDERTEDVESFFKGGNLLPSSNVQYGEGGAGTFSDGKLTTRIKNIRITKVLQEFIEAGADPAIAYQHRAHIGTDVLRDIVRNIREKVISLGGEVHFETEMLSLITEKGKVAGIHTDKGDFYTEHVILSCGHSASDTYSTLFSQGIEMIQKDFAAGVRVEHPQELIDKRQYGKEWNNPLLGAASYRLAYTASNKRGIYSFCMCPGGVVVPASCIENTLAVNGMSYSKRDGKYANSAILVQIPVSDFDKGHPLDGFTYQKQLEEKAYRTGYMAPSMNIKDYVAHKEATELIHDSSYPRGNHIEDMHTLFNDEVNTAMEEGFQYFDRKIPGFINQGIMVGMESRSSSPIRIPRNENGQSLSMQGLYPCGEGAGYAGGIVSSAVDGIKEAEQVISDLLNRH